MTTVAVLLAAGRGMRFGGGKLAAELGGIPLLHHAALALVELRLAARVAVIGPNTPNLSAFGFEQLVLDTPNAPLSASLRIGVEHALAKGATRVLVALGDMPLVPAEHYKALLNSASTEGTATCVNGVPQSPAIFGGGMLSALCGIKGDRGARELIAALPTIALDSDLALDVDTQDDLLRAAQFLIKMRAPDNPHL